MAPNPRKPRRSAPNRRYIPRIAGHAGVGAAAADSTPEAIEPTGIEATETEATKSQVTPAPADPDSSPTLDSDTQEAPDPDAEAGSGEDNQSATSADTRIPDSSSDSLGTAETETDDSETAGTDTDAAGTERVAAPTGKSGKNRTVARVTTLRPTPAAPKRDSGKAAKSRERRRTVPSTWLSRGVAMILLAVAAILAIVAVVLAAHPGAQIGSDKAFVDRQATDEVTAQTRARICAVFGIDYQKLDAWQAGAQDALTGRARTDFDSTIKARRDVITQTRAASDCRVDLVGVNDLTGGNDGSRASVIVNLIISESQAGVATSSNSPRAQFGVVKQGDQWRIETVEVF